MASTSADASASPPSTAIPLPVEPTTTQVSPVTELAQPVDAKASETPVPETVSATPATPTSEPAKATGPLTSSPSHSNKSELAVRIILLLTATGIRHPFTVNTKYLQRHNIQAAEADPWNIKVYDMKSLIWHEWLDDWETRPSSPASIRLIFMGGLLDDKAALKDCRLNKAESNVVHMMIRPQDLNEDEEVKGKEQNSGAARQGERSRCCVIL